MNNRDEILEVLVSLRSYENLLSEVYNIFSSKFSEYHSFWRDISIDENTHAFMVDTFISLYKSKNILFDNRSFPLERVNIFIDEIKKFKSKIIENDILLPEALEFAMKAENSFIEKKLFQHQDNDPPEFKKLLIALHDDSEEHYNKILNLYNQQTKKNKNDVQ